MYVCVCVCIREEGKELRGKSEKGERREERGRKGEERVRSDNGENKERRGEEKVGREDGPFTHMVSFTECGWKRATGKKGWERKERGRRGGERREEENEDRGRK